MIERIRAITDLATTVADQTLIILRRYLRFLLPEQELPMETDLTELGLDSMSAVELVLELEQTFGCKFPDEMFTQENFRDATSLVHAISTVIRENLDD